MPFTAHDILMDADLFRTVYPHWPSAEPEREALADTPEPAEPAGEFTISWGEDTNCAGCGYFLPAGAPAWPDEDGRAVCSDCVAKEG